MKSLSMFSLLTIVSFAIVLTVSFAADQRGLTGIDPQYNPPVVGAIPAAMEAVPPMVPSRDYYRSPWSGWLDDWILIESDTFEVFIPEAFQFAVSLNPANERLQFHEYTAELTSTQYAAIDRAPRWLRRDLHDNFRRFQLPSAGDIIANQILIAPDPYVDEVAFQVAHIAPDIIGLRMYPQLMLENAQGIYSADSVLGYVEIVDYGSSIDDDYWSTARYTVIDTSGDTASVEIERDVYYWYVLHPKLSDELPTYIDPATGYEAAPPTGVFWRDYLWNHADSGYALLKEQFTGCEFLWAHLNNTHGAQNGAVGLVTDWINSVMHWQVGPERPIQPVRIYALHQGYCGEHSDITAAAGRTCLIPTICTTNFCEDHTWNEFWDREWISWEPVNNMVNTPLTYENGWGKVLSAVFNWRGDGYVWTVTDRYSEGVCTLNITIYDSTGKPGDGEVIKLHSDALWGGFYYATWGVTNSQGQVSFLLGDDQDFYLRIDGPLGSYPYSGGVTTLLRNSVRDSVYNWDYTFFNATPNLNVSQAQSYPNPLDDYRMEIEYQVLYESVYGTYFTNNQFSEKMDTGSADFFIANHLNYNNYSLFLPAEGFSILQNSASGYIDFVLPTAEQWYAVLSNRELAINRPSMAGRVNIYRNSSVAVGDEAEEASPFEFALEAPSPNPFNASTVARFELRDASNIKLAIYDIAGREAAVIAEGFHSAGAHQAVWEASSMASGVYFARLTAGDMTQTRKMLLVK